MKRIYEMPQIEVLEIELEDTLCGSVEDMTDGGTYGDSFLN